MSGGDGFRWTNVQEESSPVDGVPGGRAESKYKDKIIHYVHKTYNL
jgi:hypothetical protein